MRYILTIVWFVAMFVRECYINWFFYIIFWMLLLLVVLLPSLVFWMSYLNWPILAGTKHLKSIDYSVNVPVLSKHIKLTNPPIKTLFGEIQNIFLAFNFSTAWIIPIVILTVKASCTVIVIISKNLMIISLGRITPYNRTTIIEYKNIVIQNRNAKI